MQTIETTHLWGSISGAHEYLIDITKIVFMPDLTASSNVWLFRDYYLDNDAAKQQPFSTPTNDNSNKYMVN